MSSIKKGKLLQVETIILIIIIIYYFSSTISAGNSGENL